MFDHPIVKTLLTDWLWHLGIVGVVVALAAGLLLALAPARALRLAETLNREYSFGWLRKALDEPRRMDPFFYRHHRVVGVLLVIATVYFFWSYATVLDRDLVVALYDHLLPRALLMPLATTLMAVLVISNGLGFALGAIMLVRPSLLKRSEAAANCWVDTDQAAEKLNQRIDRPEGVAQRYPRRLGVIILIATLYVAAVGLFALR